MSGRYDDIIHLSRPKSKHRPMSAYDRAAQFSPFAALNGHEEAIQETARVTEDERRLDFDGALMLDAEIRRIAERIGERPAVTVRYFEPDERKLGGAYREKTGEVGKVDSLRQCLIFTDGTEIPFGFIDSLTF